MTFHLNTITVIVLTDDGPLEGGPLDLAQILSECDEGGYVMASEHRRSTEVSPKAMAELLTAAGGDPDFFSLDKEGNSLDA